MHYTSPFMLLASPNREPYMAYMQQMINQSQASNCFASEARSQCTIADQVKPGNY